MEKVKVLVKKEEDLTLPKYESERASGLDVRVNFSGWTKEQLEERLIDDSVVTTGRGAGDEDKLAILLRKGDRFLFPTGIRVAIPEGYEIQVRPRSGLAIKRGLTILNTPGTIDSDYRGEIGIAIINHSNKGCVIEDGERIGQLILSKVEQLQWVPVKDLPSTKRGEGGFNSTGTK